MKKPPKAQIPAYHDNEARLPGPTKLIKVCITTHDGHIDMVVGVYWAISVINTTSQCHVRSRMCSMPMYTAIGYLVLVLVFRSIAYY